MPSRIRLVRSIRKKIEHSSPDLLIVTEQRGNLPVTWDDRRAVVSVRALVEATFYEGLRKAGMPEE